MRKQKQKITRQEFLAVFISKAVPLFLLIVALYLMIAIYFSETIFSLEMKILLSAFVLVLFGYPVFKVYFGVKLASFPSAYKPLIYTIKIAWLLLKIVILYYLLMHMPLLLIVFCVSLLIENESLKRKISQADKF